MRRRTVVPLVALAVASTSLGASRAMAQVNVTGWSHLYFDNYCVSGTFSACASVRLFADGNNLTMQVWNLDDVLGDRHTITALGLYHSGTVWDGTISTFAAYHVGGPSNPITSYWTPKGAGDIKNLGGVMTELREGTKGNDGIVGCEDAGGGTHWETCDSFPYAPYVQFDFTLSKAFALTGDVELRWHSQQLEDGSSLKCDTGGAGDYPPCQVVPEPVTMALLGSGLAGLGGVGLVRRRKRNGVDVENV